MPANKKIIAAGLLGLVAGAMSFSTQAAGVASASASISGFTYQLIDLNPNDGITPSLTFSDGWRGASSSSNSFTEDRIYGEGGTGVGNVNGSASTAAAAGAVASSAQTILPNEYRYGFNSDTSYVRDFTLSAGTLVIFSANASVSASLAPADVMQTAATARLFGELRSDNFNTPFGYRSSFDGYVNSVNQGRSDLVLLGSLHSLNRTSFGSIGMGTATQAHWFDSPPDLPRAVRAVPEPASYAMLFAGLGLVGVAARRRRGAAPSIPI